MKRQNDRAEQLRAIGSTSALAGAEEIISNGSAPGILARQLIAILDRRESPEDRDSLIIGFCDELETFVEPLPDRANPPAPERTRRIRP